MAEKERTLTPAEQKRKEAFEKISAEMEQKGYQKTDLTVGIVKANALAILIMLPFAALACGVFFAIRPFGTVHFAFPLYKSILFWVGLILLVVMHEAIHGLTWGAFAESHWKAISFGVIWSMLTPYCTCAESLTKKQYIIGSAMPTLILGFGLTVLAAVLGDFWLFALSFAMIFGGGGDALIILKMLLHKTQGKEVLYYDHPYECGLVVFEKS